MSKLSVYTLCLAMIWGSSFPISQLGVEQIGAMPFRVLTILFSTIILIIFTYNKLKASLANVSCMDIVKLSLLAIPNIFIVPMINNISLAYMSVSTATLLIYLMPCFVSLLTMLDEKKVSYISIAATTLCISGVLILSKFNSFNISEYLMIFNAFIWGLGAILSKKIVISSCSMSIRVTIQMIATLTLTLLVTSIWWAIDGSIFDKFRLNYLLDYTTIISILYIGGVGSALVYYLWFKLIDLNSAEFTSYATLLSPIISIAIAVTIFDEILDNYMIVGGVLIFSSSCIVLLRPLVCKLLNQVRSIVT
ncbi:DMT family transporter [Vibrio maritimus]|uniref:DMT family transporter n=1 Tax=Vibrio maritimus TaxID=990268 RepID=UPI001F1E93FA|nr:DMT family transporter [Vibrio maritimus]